MKKSMIGFCMLIGASTGYAGAMGDITQAPEENYIGVFGGGGTISSTDLAQLGTAFYTEAKGGPLAVNAFGTSNRPSMWMVGGQVGHLFPETTLLLQQWSLNPGIELEGYYIGKSKMRGDDINNGTTRLTEHDFHITYPLSTGVGIINAIARFNNPNYSRWHPYLGGGFGAAEVSVTNAFSLQTAPLEPGVNHYNSDPSDTDTVLAAQGKVGLSFDLTNQLIIFAEYRYLYLSALSFTLGSTVYPNHPATSNWNLLISSQSQNMGVGGVKYAF